MSHVGLTSVSTSEKCLPVIAGWNNKGIGQDRYPPELQTPFPLSLNTTTHLFSLMISSPIELHPIGYVRSPYLVKSDAPRQGRLSDTVSEIVIAEKYRPALWQIEGRKHLWVLCWFDRADRTVLRATPPGTSAEKGVFAIRSPDRPNPLSLCMVDLIGVKDGVLKVRGLDAFDGTPVIDIKTYSSDIDCARNG